ncbi:MAG: DUF983 domain-containing protein [Gemmatimonadota bacterium]|jgi:uncharacterized protein (DUF983 family)|nr:DUF983 domain-containing protein [Gemmatimonadota bacterium]
MVDQTADHVGAGRGEEPVVGVGGKLERAPRNFEELSVSRAIRLATRGIVLRCPHCGAGRLRESWMKLVPSCPSCGLRTDRGEEDFFLGGMMWNIVFAEGLLLLSAVLIGILTWPDVPWTLLQWVGTALMVIAPFVFYPFSLGFWLACDILIRPVTEEELSWHRENPSDTFRHIVDR